MSITIAAVAGGIFVACLAPLGCAPDLGAGRPAPAIAPCEGTGVIVAGFDSLAGCDLTPPQTMSVNVDNVDPWTPVQTDGFYADCADHGGTVTDNVGQTWVCQSVDY